MQRRPLRRDRASLDDQAFTPKSTKSVRACVNQSVGLLVCMSTAFHAPPWLMRVIE